MSSSESFHYAALYGFGTNKIMILSKTKIHQWLHGFFQRAEVEYVEEKTELTQENIIKAIKKYHDRQDINLEYDKSCQLRNYKRSVKSYYRIFLKKATENL